MENELYHYGVLGMKWGVRKDRSRSSGSTKTSKNSKDKQVRSRRRSDVKKRRTMSDADLKRKIERLKLEQQFKDLTENDISPGRKAVKNILSSSGQRVLTMAAAGAMAYGVKVAMTGKFDIAEAAAYVAANPNKKK